MYRAPGKFSGGGSSTTSEQTTVVDDDNDSSSSGSSGGSSSSDSDYDYEVDTTSIDYNNDDDPLNSGMTGSEMKANSGDASAVATIDPNADSVEEKMEQDGASATVTTFTDLASEADDEGDGTTFDYLPDNETGQSVIQSASEAFSNAAANVANNESAENADNQQDTPIPNPFAGMKLQLPMLPQQDSSGGTLKMMVLAAVAMVVAFAFGGS